MRKGPNPNPWLFRWTSPLPGLCCDVVGSHFGSSGSTFPFTQDGRKMTDNQSSINTSAIRQQGALLTPAPPNTPSSDLTLVSSLFHLFPSLSSLLFIIPLLLLPSLQAPPSFPPGSSLLLVSLFLPCFPLSAALRRPGIGCVVPFFCRIKEKLPAEKTAHLFLRFLRSLL